MIIPIFPRKYLAVSHRIIIFVINLSRYETDRNLKIITYKPKYQPPQIIDSYGNKVNNISSCVLFILVCVCSHHVGAHKNGQ